MLVASCHNPLALNGRSSLGFFEVNVVWKIDCMFIWHLVPGYDQSMYLFGI